MKYSALIILSLTLICAVSSAEPGLKADKGGVAVATESGFVVGAPETLRLMIVQNGFQLKWTVSPQDSVMVTGYEIVRSDRFTGPFDPVATVGQGTSQFTDTTALPEIIYYYKVRTVAGKHYSPFSNTVAGER